MKVTENLIYISEIVSSNFLFCQAFVCPPLSFSFFVVPAAHIESQNSSFVDSTKKYERDRPGRGGAIAASQILRSSKQGRLPFFSRTGIFTDRHYRAFRNLSLP